jgi:hypothetical protein
VTGRREGDAAGMIQHRERAHADADARGRVTPLGLLVFLVLGLSISPGCSGGNVAPGDRDYPADNPAPKNYLWLHGTIDPSLDINFRIQWLADNPGCRYTASWIEHVFVPYYASSPLPIDDRHGNSFSTRVPIDGVLSGRCEWRFAGVSFAGPIGFRTSLIVTNSPPLRPGQSADGVLVLSCKWTTKTRARRG